MGKRGGKKFRGGRGGRAGGGGGGGGHRSAPRANYSEVVKENEKLERYYNEAGLVDQDEKDDFWAALKRDLPNSFRFAGSKGHALSVQQRLKDHYIPEIAAIDIYEGEKVTPPYPISWFPDQLAWAMTTPKNIVRRHPPFASFQKFLVSETSVGNISRQEAVSMIPPLLMDIRPGMTVLDMCAAPGSKAAQLIEMVHAGEEANVRHCLRKLATEEGREASPDGLEVKLEDNGYEHVGDRTDDGRSTGLLIANDADYKRSHMLIHQMKRLNSPNLIVTNHDATMFPSIRLTSDAPAPGQKPRNRYLKFDRILADVPCSGDGTARKNPNLWRDWSPANALGLHQTQVRILVRALQMLKVAGRVIYSTCSMNPIENEAAVAAAIERCGGLSKVKIVDCSAELPGLQRRPGLTRWKVMDKSGRMWNSWKEVEEQKQKEGPDGLGRLAESMFALDGEVASSSDAQTVPLEKCMRVYAHLQDTGAFFIAVLEKLSEIKTRPEAMPKSEATQMKPDQAPDRLPPSSVPMSAPKEPAPAPPISAMIAGIAAHHEDGTASMEKLDALDELLPPDVGPLEDASAAARQNQENSFEAPIKRENDAVEDEGDARQATKRLKIKEDTGDIAVKGEDDRQVHWPPPPEVELYRHQPEAPSMFEKPEPSPSSKNKQTFEEPFKYLSADHNELQTIFDYYNISPRFPRDRFLVRNASGEPVKTIYYSSVLAREILTENEGKGIKFVHCGVKMFMRQDVQKIGTCKWRIQTEGMPILEGWVGEERVVRLYKRDTLRKLLIEMFPKVNGDGWMDLAEIGERVRDLDMGCCVLRVEVSEGEDGFSDRMALPLWRSLHSLNLMLPKEDRRAMLLRLFNDYTPLEHMPARNGQQEEVNGQSEPDATETQEDAVTAEDPDGLDDGANGRADKDKDNDDKATAETGMIPPE